MSRRAGRRIGNSPPQGEGWFWMTGPMLGSLTFRALGINARRALDFLIAEHLAHGGQENGRLGASYRQLHAWGLTRDDIRKGLDELIVCGFIRRTVQGLRQAGGGDPSRFALTWLPTGLSSGQACPPTEDWVRVLAVARAAGVVNVATAKRWLRDSTPKSARRTAVEKQIATPHLRPVSLLKCDRLAG